MSEKMMALVNNKRGIDTAWVNWLIDHQGDVVPLVTATKEIITQPTMVGKWDAGVKPAGDILVPYLDDLLGPDGSEDIPVDDVFNVGTAAKVGALSTESKRSIGGAIAMLPELIALARMLYQIFKAVK